MYSMLKYKEIQEIKEIQYSTSFAVHLILKLIPIGMYLFESTFTKLIGEIVVNQLIIFFVVIDFWMTKNVNGRRMIGVKWYYENDHYGIERFKFQCRANPELISDTYSQLFWLVLFLYAVVPFIFVIATFFIGLNTESI